MVVLLVDGGMSINAATGDEADVEVPAFLGETTVLGALLVRLLGLVIQLVASPLLVVTILPPVLLGVWAARRRVLEALQDHLVVVRRTAVVGLGASIIGGAPFALVVGGSQRPGRGVAAPAGLRPQERRNLLR